MPSSGGAHCEPVIARADNAGADALGSLVWSTYLNAFVVVTFSEDINGQQGYFLRTSLDLLAWSAPKRVFDVPLPWGANASVPGLVTFAYVSLLDPSSTAPNFDVVGQHATLFFVRNRVGENLKRDVMRVPVEFTTTDLPAAKPVGGFGCYRDGAAGRFDNGEGAYCNLLDVDLPGICGVPKTGFASLPRVRTAP